MIEARATGNSVTQQVRIRSTPNHAVPDTPSLVLTCRTSRFETLPVLDDCSTLWIDSTKPVNIEWDPLFQKYCLHEIRFRTQANKSNGTTGPTSSSPLCSARSLSCARLICNIQTTSRGGALTKCNAGSRLSEYKARRPVFLDPNNQATKTSRIHTPQHLEAMTLHGLLIHDILRIFS